MRRIAAVAATALVFAGAYWLDARGNVAYGYGGLVLGALLLLALRECEVQGGGAARPLQSRWWWLLIALLLFAGAGLIGWAAWSIYAPVADLTGPAQIGLWIGGGLVCIAAFHLCDRWRHPEPFPLLFERADWLWMLGLFVAAAAARILNLAVEPPGLAPDEVWPLAYSLKLVPWKVPSAFGIDYFSNTLLYHLVVSFFLTHFGWIGLDTVQTAKLANALFGAGSIALLSAAARLLATRAIAATAGVFLIWQGWHWILSRLYYVYAGDLFWISLTTVLLVAGLKSGRLSLMAAAGFAGGIGVSWLKTAIMVGPWIAIVCGEHFLTARPRRVRNLWKPVVCLAALALFLLPLAAQSVREPVTLWRFRDVSKQREKLLAEKDLTPAQGDYKGFLGAFTVLQISEAAQGRHVVRLGRPALDLIASALATVGFLWCALHSVRDRGARLCVLGFLVFLWPAVSSYPADAIPAASRRMAGSSLFVAWMAAYGAAVVTGRVFAARQRLPAMLALAAASMVLNVYYIRTSYNTRLYHWHEELGVNRVYIIRALRQAAALGPVFFHPTYFTELAKHGVEDLPNVTLVHTPADLRAGLLQHAGELCSVLLPTDGAVGRNDTPAWIAALADIIPPSLWEFGPPDPTGLPLYRLAHIRVPKAGPPSP